MYRVISLNYSYGQDFTSFTVYEFENECHAVAFSACAQENDEEAIAWRERQKSGIIYHEKKLHRTLTGALAAIRETEKYDGHYDIPFILEENCEKFKGCYKAACAIWVEKHPDDFFTFNAIKFRR